METPSKEELKYQEMYKVLIVCSNCGVADYFTIPKGTSVKEFNNNFKCTNCGCYRCH